MWPGLLGVETDRVKVDLRGLLRRWRQVLPLVVALGILAGLGASSVVATQSAARNSERQHLADQVHLVRLAASSLNPNRTPQDTEALGRVVGSFIGVRPHGTAAELAVSLSRIGAALPGTQAAVYEGQPGVPVATTPGWTTAMSSAVGADVVRSVAHGSMYHSDVIAAPAGPFSVEAMLVRGWGSPKPRLLVMAAPLDSSMATDAAKFISNSSILVLDSHGVVRSARKQQLLGTRPAWWPRSGLQAAGGMRQKIGGVDSQLVAAPIPDTSFWLVAQDPLAEFNRSFGPAGQRTELAIVLLAAFAGGLLMLSNHRRAVTARRGESRLGALLEDTGDAVLVVRHGIVTYASGGSMISQVGDLVGQPLPVVFDGALAPALDLPAGTSKKVRFDACVPVAGGEERWVEATVASRHADPSVRGLVISLHDVTERRQLQHQLHFEATHDHLTGLVNRNQFAAHGEQALARQRRDGGGVAVMYLDLDGFKPINDEHGHQAGDAVLRAVAGRLRTCVREHETVARLGGDEFAILLDNAAAADAHAVARRIQRAFEEPIPLDGEAVSVGVSVGIAYDPTAAGAIETLIRDADIAMYATKRARNRLTMPAPR
jgi:diguanylate cyclase (GGDEF)-like protein